MATIEASAVQTRRASGLKASTLNLFDATVIATSSVAPAYSLAATAFILVGVVGFASPAAILVSFFPVLFIAMAYYYLNRRNPNCGASYSWISSTMSPYVGWFSGWVQIAANVLFCAAAPIVAATYTLQLLHSLFPGQISNDAVSSPFWIAVAGLLWLALVTTMVARGIRVTADFQWVMVGIEYLAIFAFAILAFIKVATTHPAGSSGVSLSWFNPGTIFSGPGITGLVAGVALGVFFFWGWDTAANVNEETKDASRAPGQAGIISMFLLLFIFLLVSSAMQSLLSQDTITKQGTNAFFYFASQIVPAPWSYIMILAVVSSTVATVQTTLLPQSRLSFSMARDHVFPRIFAILHPQWQTPWVGTIIAGAISAVLIVVQEVLSSNSSVTSVFANLILDIGVLVGVYYGITGLASAWAYRKMLTSSASMLIFAGILPFLGGLALLFVGFEVISPAKSPWGTSPSWAASLPDLILLGLGVPLTAIAALTNRSGFFKQKTIAYTRDNDIPTVAAAAPVREEVGVRK